MEFRALAGDKIKIMAKLEKPSAIESLKEACREFMHYILLLYIYLFTAVQSTTSTIVHCNVLIIFTLFLFLLLFNLLNFLFFLLLCTFEIFFVFA